MVIYFSATGTNKYVAQELAKATGDTLLPLKNLVREDKYDIKIANDENLGIVMPTYWEGLPSILLDYLEKVHFVFAGCNHYCYFVTTYGCDYGNILSNQMSALGAAAAKANYNRIRKTRRFKLADDKCIGCELCARQCPLDAIEMQQGRPVWVKEKCTLCLGCFHRCPAGAIDYDGGLRNGQYVYDKVKLDN